MRFFNLGLPEIILIVILALIIFGPGNMVKTAKEAGALIRKITKSPYWKEVWATKRELNELPKMLAREAHLDETLQDLNRESQKISSSVAETVSELMKEVEEPIKKAEKDLNADLNPAPAAKTPSGVSNPSATPEIKKKE